ncbi:MAG: hypothetical protein ACR2PT_21745 [Endozoicomonas sp.]
MIRLDLMMDSVRESFITEPLKIISGFFNGAKVASQGGRPILQNTKPSDLEEDDVEQPLPLDVLENSDSALTYLSGLDSIQSVSRSSWKELIKASLDWPINERFTLAQLIGTKCRSHGDWDQVFNLYKDQPLTICKTLIDQVSQLSFDSTHQAVLAGYFQRANNEAALEYFINQNPIGLFPTYGKNLLQSLLCNSLTEEQFDLVLRCVNKAGLDSGALLNALDENGFPMFFHVDPELIRKLPEAGANMNLLDAENRNIVLHHAHYSYNSVFRKPFSQDTLRWLEQSCKVNIQARDNSNRNYSEYYLLQMVEWNYMCDESVLELIKPDYIVPASDDVVKKVYTWSQANFRERFPDERVSHLCFITTEEMGSYEKILLLESFPLNISAYKLDIEEGLIAQFNSVGMPSTGVLVSVYGHGTSRSIDPNYLSADHIATLISGYLSQRSAGGNAPDLVRLMICEAGTPLWKQLDPVSAFMSGENTQDQFARGWARSTGKDVEVTGYDGIVIGQNSIDVVDVTLGKNSRSRPISCFNRLIYGNDKTGQQVTTHMTRAGKKRKVSERFCPTEYVENMKKKPSITFRV